MLGFQFSPTAIYIALVYPFPLSEPYKVVGNFIHDMIARSHDSIDKLPDARK